MVDTAFGELPTPLVAASMAEASTNTANQQLSSANQNGMDGRT